MKNLYKIKSVDDLNVVALDLKKSLKNGMIISLKGTLGSGKTTLVKNIVKLFDEQVIVQSPTFSIVNEYRTNKFNFVHIDAYRMNSFEDFLEEYFDDENIIFIEWFEKLSLPSDIVDMEISIDVIDDNNRELKVKEN